MQGLFVKHTYHGLGQIQQVAGGVVRVAFFESDTKAQFDETALEDRELVRVTLPLGAACRFNDEPCTVAVVQRNSHPTEPHEYEMAFADGARKKASEAALTLTNDESLVADPKQVLGSLAQGGYPLFESREGLVKAFEEFFALDPSYRALLSPRRDLTGKQRHLLQRIFKQPQRRFFLSDSSGQGSVLTAGAIIHELTSADPHAKILLLCPGSVTQDWLLSLYRQFGGLSFRLLEMHDPDEIDWANIQRAIAPLSSAALDSIEALAAVEWDLVIVDEAHHVTTSLQMFNLVQRLSKNAPGLLMLGSAPTAEQIDERLTLLSLLRPNVFTPKLLSDRADATKAAANDESTIFEFPVEPIAVPPEFSPLEYEPDDEEIAITEAVDKLLATAVKKKMDETLIHQLTRMLYRSLATPSAAWRTMTALVSTPAEPLEPLDIERLSLLPLAGYEQWERCHELIAGAARDALPITRLKAMVKFAKKWADRGNEFARMQALSSRLYEILATEEPPPKIVIVAGYPDLAADLVEALTLKFENHSVMEFRGDAERVEGEANLERFRESARPVIAVCDEVSHEAWTAMTHLIHFDTSWNLRHLRTRQVTSESAQETAIPVNTLAAKDGVEAAIINCYQKSLSAYTAPLMGYEFVSDQVEAKLAGAALGGAAEIDALPAEEIAKPRVANETAFKESKTPYTAEQEEIARRNLEEAFTDHLRMIASRRSVWRATNDSLPNGSWTLRTDEAHQVRGAAARRLFRQEPATGVFQRALAQEHARLDFFTVGHPIFETIRHSLTLDVAGCTYAVDVAAPGEPVFAGFEFVFEPEPDLSEVSAWPLRQWLRRWFAGARCHMFFDIDAQLADINTLLPIRRSLDRGDKNQTWWNLTKERALLLQELFDSPPWSQRVENAFTAAEETAREQMTPLLAGVLQLAEKETKAYPEDAAVLKKALQNWKLRLDGAGFISLNGRLA